MPSPEWAGSNANAGRPEQPVRRSVDLLPGEDQVSTVEGHRNSWVQSLTGFERTKKAPLEFKTGFICQCNVVPCGSKESD